MYQQSCYLNPIGVLVGRINSDIFSQIKNVISFLSSLIQYQSGIVYLSQ